MERKRITCPETAHLEEIDLDRTPFGTVITACSRFSPTCAVTCARDCAARMDRRDRSHLEPALDRVLIVYADRDGHVRQIAERLSEALQRDAFAVELADADVRAAPPPQDYDAIVLGSHLRLGHYERSLLQYITQHCKALASPPAFHFAVAEDEAACERARRYMTDVSQLGWPSLWREAFEAHDAVAPVRHEAKIREFARRIADEVPARDG